MIYELEERTLTLTFLFTYFWLAYPAGEIVSNLNEESQLKASGQRNCDNYISLSGVKSEKNPKFASQKISSFVIKKPYLLCDLTYFNKVKFGRNFRSCSKN